MVLERSLMKTALFRMTTLAAFALLITLPFVPVVSATPDVMSACATVTAANPTPSDTCTELMQENMQPAAVQIDLDRYTLSSYTYWHVITEGAANVFDVPDGNVTRQIEPGFNFVIATDTESSPGWIEIQGGGWMHAEDIKLIPPSYFRGDRLLNRLEQPMGWIMYNLYAANHPGGSQDYHTNPLLLKYDLFNVFASVTMDDGIVWYMIGPNQWLEQRSVAIAKTTERPEQVSGRWVAVDLYEQTLVAYEDDVPVFATLVATGLPNWDTNEGIFNIWARAIADPMSGAAGSPQAYALQSVPWVMYFDGGISLHGTYWHDGFGYRHSHGCVNLSVSDARWIYEWTNENPPDENGLPNTFVYVYSSGVYGQFGIAQG
jgi:hypothetical protein